MEAQATVLHFFSFHHDDPRLLEKRIVVGSGGVVDVKGVERPIISLIFLILSTHLVLRTVGNYLITLSHAVFT